MPRGLGSAPAVRTRVARRSPSPHLPRGSARRRCWGSVRDTKAARGRRGARWVRCRPGTKGHPKEPRALPRHHPAACTFSHAKGPRPHAEIGPRAPEGASAWFQVHFFQATASRSGEVWRRRALSGRPTLLQGSADP